MKYFPRSFAPLSGLQPFITSVFTEFSSTLTIYFSLHVLTPSLARIKKGRNSSGGRETVLVDREKGKPKEGGKGEMKMLTFPTRFSSGG
jgi:hypothetical protein